MATAIDWDSDLPQAFEAGSYQFEHGSGIVRTEMDSGPPKVRRRFTAIYHRHSGSMVMLKTTYTSDFLTFFGTTLYDGTLSFNFPNPMDDGATTIECRFLQGGQTPPYQMKQFSPTSVILTFTLEEMP